MNSDKSLVDTRPLFEMQLSVGNILSVGPEGSQGRVASISGGSFKGERVKGIILPGGTDWQRLRSDGALTLDARIVLETDTGGLIAMTYSGIRTGPPDVMARLARGEPVDQHSYYFRILPTFSTSVAKFDWLNRIVGLGIGDRRPEGPSYSVHEIL